MAGFLSFQVLGQPRLQKIINALPLVFNFVNVLDEGAAVLYNRMRTRFLQQIDPDGIPWPRSQAAQKGNRSTLFATGKLFRSIQLYADGPDSRAIGTDVTSAGGFPYGIIHQYGGKNTPQRAFLGFNQQEDVPYMSDLVLKRIEEALQ